MKPKNRFEEQFCRMLDSLIARLRETSQSLRRNQVRQLRGMADRIEQEANEEELRWDAKLLKREGIEFKDGVFQPCRRT